MHYALPVHLLRQVYVGCFFGSWAALGPLLGALGRSWDALGALLGRSWTLLGHSGGALGQKYEKKVEGNPKFEVFWGGVLEGFWPS